MTAKRVNWFEVIGAFVQFYPKMTAIIAFSSMAAVGRMMPSSREAVSVIPAKPVEAPRVVKPAIRSTKRRSTAPKTSKRGVPEKRTGGRRKAA
jgi:hypothetical protein